jgi:hypothetical protein
MAHKKAPSPKASLQPGHRKAAARRLTALRSCSVPKKRCSCRPPRAAGRCAQKGAVAVGCLAAWLHEAAARRLAAPRSFPGAATAAAAHRERRGGAHKKAPSP